MYFSKLWTTKYPILLPQSVKAFSVISYCTTPKKKKERRRRKRRKKREKRFSAGSEQSLQAFGKLFTRT